MTLPVSYFEYKNFTFDIKNFVQYWTTIYEIIYSKYTCDEIYEFKHKLEQIKQKKFYEFTTPQEEASSLRNIIHSILVEEYDNTPLEIFKEFYSHIKNDMHQGMYGHYVSIYIPQNKAFLKSEIYNYTNFYKFICDFNDNSWPHHYVLKKEAFYKVP
jgi:hypothetical protein